MPQQVLSDVQIAEVWIGAGGTSEGAILQWAVCVALAESGGETGVISPSADYGLWQINRIHFGDGIINAGNWSDPTTNAREAISLSGNGQNWAAWCTAWANPAGNCGHGYLHTPQPGSPAYLRIWQVQNDLAAAGKLTGTTTAAANPAPNVAADIPATWGYVQDYVAQQAPAQWGRLHGQAGALDALRP